MGRAYMALTAVALAACGDGGAGAFDPCRDTGAIIVAPLLASGTFALDADERGYVVFWGSDPVEPGDPREGVHAARPGEAPVLLALGGNGAHVVAAKVAAGHLVCWSGDSSALDGPCLVVDPDLRVVVPAFHPAEGNVVALGYIGAVRFALVTDEPFGATTSLVPIDELGAARAPGTRIACPPWPPERLAFSDEGLGCLVPSDARCGTQLEPPDCRFDLVVHAPDGTAVLQARAVAPFGGFGLPVKPQLAYHDGHFVVAWTDVSNRSFTRDVPSVGPFAAPVAQAQPSERLFAGASGLVHVWGEVPPRAPEYRLLRAAPLSPTGAPSAAAPWLAAPEGALRVHDATGMAFASAGGGVAMAWSAFSHESAAFLLFRSLGCSVGR